MLWLPAATRDHHARSNPWAETTDPKGCLHTTETSGWPGYNGWTYHPHATVMPKPGVGVEIRQHLPFNQGSFALRNLSGGVQTNRDYVFQFELIGTSEKGGPGYFWPGADDTVLIDLYRKLIKPVSDAFGIPVKAQPFQSYPSSYGARGKTNTVRMAGPAFDSYSGWLGHQHVPENVHGDPGAFPWARMVVLGTPKPTTPATPPKETDMSLTSADVRVLWSSKVIPLTATDAKVFNRTAPADNQFEAGDLVALSDMVRYGTLDRKNETRLINLESKVDAILAAITNQKEDTP